MKHLYSKVFLFLFFALVAFFFDVSMQLFFPQQLSYFILCYLIYHIIYHPHKANILFLTALLCAESFFYTNVSWLPIVYVPMIIGGIRFIQYSIDFGNLLLPITTTGGIIITILFTHSFGTNGPSLWYTASALCGTILIMRVISLKYKNTNTQDNRSPFMRREESPDSP